MVKYRSLFIFLFLALLFGGMIVGVHQTFTSQVPGANDFLPRWIGTQLFWQDGIDPYSDEATAIIQQNMYGRPALPEEDQVLFVYPFYTTFLLLPLTFLPVDYSWIQAIWLVTVMFALITAVILTIRLVNWQMPPWLLGITLLWAIIFYNSTRTIILGQFAGLIYLWIVGSLLALRADKDVLAGLLLALTTIKPQMSYLLVPALLIWALGQKRWRFIGSFTAIMLGLVGLSFVLQPNWLFSFIEQVLFYPAYTITGSPLWVITSYYFPQLGKPVETIMIILLLLYLIWQWRALLRVKATSNHFLFIIGLTLIITNMIVVRTATTNYVIMYIPLFMALKELSKRVKYGNIWVAVFQIGSIFFTWALFLATIEGDLEHPVTYLPLPFLLLGIMIIFSSWWTKANESLLIGESV